LGPLAWISLSLLPALLADVVAIESEPADATLGQVAIESCSGALGGSNCRDVNAPGEPATWFVRVIWDVPERRRAIIEVRRAARDGELATVRAVEFSTADALAQRERAVGLIIAAFVLEQARADQAEAAAAQANEAARTESAKPEGAASQANAGPEARSQSESERDANTDDDADADDDADEEPGEEADDDITAESGLASLPAWAVDAAVIGAPGLDRGAPRFGGQVRALFRPAPVGVYLLASVRAARRWEDEDPSLFWLGASAGAALRWQTPARPLALEARGEAVFERVQATAEDDQNDRQETGDALRGGARAGLELHARLGTYFGLFAGAEISLLFPSVYIDVGRSPKGVERNLGWSALCGARVMH
jgi:hypothetical protein